MANSSVTHKNITAFWSLATLDSTYALYLRATLNSKITTKKHKYVENVTLDNQKKDTCLQCESCKTEHHPV